MPGSTGRGGRASGGEHKLSGWSRVARTAGQACASPPAQRCGKAWCASLLGVLAAPDLEGYDDLGDAAEQGEEPDPEQQERATGGEQLLGGPEAEHELQD